MNCKKTLLVVFLFMSILGSAWAQAPYKHSVGVTVGNFDGFSYKTFFTDHMALQLDFGYKVIVSAGQHSYNVLVNSLEVNPNLMYEGHFTNGLYGFVGGGLSLGYSWYGGWYYYGVSSYGKFGINTIAGLEYKFNIPLTLQFDFRPGYGLLFDNYFTWSYFDWSVNAGVRYTF